ncbi:MAG TPA: bifunctional diaminohydroxyphosphoribosylaminopyrimidine deaminase/5-amino-6-(5-phosphoribosylamino)uracil reductase RibD [Steroidobacteraceae bacterium]|jgi:diaminohydroxyphosphoribosylaminopyrimidine deaminase/5-amino-6-(5-phosphoribosylamino)uracil reductase|nr:bifunctional diaminohydroxyphosphoribosylaminopyrimidine deaminase/5-amino-6-(5-phosphoribosylamino)uracil reductase RibD [Steroidobacteraceae bacterium]
MPAQFNAFDRLAMARALELAEQGLASTHPNPRVGCVIARDERIVGEGWHERAGAAHAEVMALAAAGAAAAGASVYVTLEPCSYFGRTPPCADALIEARVARVVFAIEDPNPRVGGAGALRLRQAGIAVQSGLLTREAEELNAGYLSRMRRRRPWVRIKLAMSLDGRTALANGRSRWITGEAARIDVQQWRARSSAVLTGIGTILADDPRLDVRLDGAQRQPLRVALDSHLRTPPAARILAPPGEALLFTSIDDAARRSVLERHGAKVERLAAPRPELGAVLARLAELEINEVLVEAGPTLAGAFVQAGYADELLLYVAPMLLGPQARPLLQLVELTELAQARRFTLSDMCTIGADVRLRLRPA